MAHVASLSAVGSRLSRLPLPRLASSLAAFPAASISAPGLASSRHNERVSRRAFARMAPAVTASAAAPRVAAEAGPSVPVADLLAAAEAAANKGAAVIMAALDKPRDITYKGATDLVTNTDRESEAAVVAEILRRFPSHLLLGEEGGVTGDASSPFLWCVDPLDGTTNFAHGYPSFATSVAVLFRGKPVAACVVEFAGGPHCWVTRTFTASAGGGAFCNGHRIHASTTDKVERALLVTGFGYEHDAAWAANIDLFKHFTDVSRGVRRLGAAAVDMCHVALGVVDAFWEFRLKPWDMAAGVLIAEEAGARVTCMDGGDFSVFDRSVLITNGPLHHQMLATIAPTTMALIADGFDFSHWLKPADYESDV
ncbi:hypothetical protein CLOM_g7670 [Closterium sp. NIES-68]|nr:hypothetical protein CLOM_g7670 [Closterium sp. NIES-68]GJP72588.1 hypothetical protein CLOP_g3301 [Closterium sp. NIES-67]